MLKYIFPIKFKIRILYFMLLPKTVFHLKFNTTVGIHGKYQNIIINAYAYCCRLLYSLLMPMPTAVAC